MNAHVLRHELETSSRFLLLLACGILLFAYGMTAAYLPMRDSMQAALKSVPSFLKPLIQMKTGFNSFEGFISLTFTHPVLLALLVSWPISRSSEAIAGEIERKTLGWMLSYPLSRTSFLGSKALVIYGGMACLTLTLLGGLLTAVRIFGVPHADVGNYARAGFATFLLYAAIGSLTLWASAALSGPGRSAMAGTGFTIASLLLHTVAQVYEPLKPLDKLSIFAYYDPKALLNGGPLDATHMAILGGLCLLGLGMAWWTLGRRDLSI